MQYRLANEVSTCIHAGLPSTPGTSIAMTNETLVSTNLAFWYWPDPAQGQVDRNRDDSYYPENFAILLAIISKDDSKYNTTKVACCASASRYDTYIEN